MVTVPSVSNKNLLENVELTGLGKTLLPHITKYDSFVIFMYFFMLLSPKQKQNFWRQSIFSVPIKATSR
jgi:hypothetical protein